MAIEYYSPVDINGNLTLTAGGPKLTLVDSTDDDDQQILFTNSSGTVDYRIHTSDFTGAGGGDGMYIGSTQSDGEVCLVTHDTIALTLDTSQNATFAGDITVGDDLFIADNGIINVGTGNDLNIQHDGSDNIINSNTGHLYITNYADDKDIIFRGDDGGNNIITALTLDMSDAGKALFNTRIQTSAVDVSDSNAVIYRNSNDLALITYAGYNIELDSAGDITLDAAGNDVLFKDAGTHIGTINMSNSDLSILSSVNDKDIIFKGKDGGSDITALTLDMSDGGKATFNNDVVAFSDKKLKDNIETLDGKKVLDMRGVSFTRKDTGLPGSGVIAQEIQKVAPELVNETNGTLGVSYGNLVGYLIEAIKDQQKQIDELKEMCNGCSK